MLASYLDPKTGYPTQGLRGVTLISDKIGRLNGLGAALMVSGAESGRTRLKHMLDVDAPLVDANNQLWTSAGYVAKLYGLFRISILD